MHIKCTQWLITGWQAEKVLSILSQVEQLVAGDFFTIEFTIWSHKYKKTVKCQMFCRIKTKTSFFDNFLSFFSCFNFTFYGFLQPLTFPESRLQPNGFIFVSICKYFLSHWLQKKRVKRKNKHGITREKSTKWNKMITFVLLVYQFTLYLRWRVRSTTEEQHCPTWLFSCL